MHHDAEIAVYYEYVILPQTDFLEVSIGQSNMVAYWLHKSIDPRTPKTNLPFWKEQGYLILLSVACPKFHCFLKWLSEILSDRSLPQILLQHRAHVFLNQQFQEGRLRFIYINKRSIQLSVPLTYPSKSLRTSIPSPPHPKAI